jgi:hypothetical protein
MSFNTKIYIFFQVKKREYSATIQLLDRQSPSKCIKKLQIPTRV